MKLTILGGGGFRVPQVYQAVAHETAPVQIDELVLYDTDPTRLNAILAVIAGLKPERSRVVVRATTELDDALRGADFIFCAIRVGGTIGRTFDERIALDLGVLGQETTGPGGLAYALRTVPVMMSIAQRVRELAPEAWFINFTNPAGIVTEALSSVLDQVVGICDTPIGLLKRAARAVTGYPVAQRFDYVGLNHLGWLRSFEVDGVNRLPELLNNTQTLGGIEEAQLMGVEWVQALGALPNEYLYYYYHSREAVASITAAKATRGEFLVRQQATFFEAATAEQSRALALWQNTMHEREATYMAEGHPEGRGEQIDVGGYQQVALEIMAALTTGRSATMILNIRNGKTVPGIDPAAVVEVPCTVDSSGIHPHTIAPVTGHMLGLMQSVKAVEQLTIGAVVERSAELAWKAFACHPLVDSVSVGQELLTRYRAAHDPIEQLFSAR